MQARNTSDLIELENRFWQSMVDEDTDTALSMLDEPALMVSEYGAMQFDHSQYRKMAEQGKMVIKSFELSDMNVVFPTDETAVLTYRVKQAMAPRGQDELIRQEMADSSVWTRKGGQWRCVMHTETPVSSQQH
ncbi:nuclear transport factor 2 family protein [Piscinibacter sp. HJYY11]|uniref:nuclear transport factor 2 family protein n=1 Tax=Piscinibacter sp. HJYY11 TaxID=2801333 RepID=UPI00191C9982|nr:nuclear transport factor 2 family protein [Piscinibacter sp. HJYY11]MBL0730725.1 nuclear transport factor 2 family protein [Piscinibacter sp. HJYY11]